MIRRCQLELFKETRRDAQYIIIDAVTWERFCGEYDALHYYLGAKAAYESAFIQLFNAIPVLLPTSERTLVPALKADGRFNPLLEYLKKRMDAEMDERLKKEAKEKMAAANRHVQPDSVEGAE